MSELLELFRCENSHCVFFSSNGTGTCLECILDEWATVEDC